MVFTILSLVSISEQRHWHKFVMIYLFCFWFTNFLNWLVYFALVLNFVIWWENWITIYLEWFVPEPYYSIFCSNNNITNCISSSFAKNLISMIAQPKKLNKIELLWNAWKEKDDMKASNYVNCSHFDFACDIYLVSQTC